jgi:hypothetical protein
MSLPYLLHSLTHPLKKRTCIEPLGTGWIVAEKNFIQAFVDDSVAYGLSTALDNLWVNIAIPPNER